MHGSQKNKTCCAMKEKDTYIYKYVSMSLKIIKNARIPLYSNKFSRKDYTQHQHLAMIMLKNELKTSYEGIAELVSLMPSIRKLLKLSKVPHYTTLHKFFQRFSHDLINRLIGMAKRVINSGIIAIDASGFSLHNASRYYERRINKIVSKKRWMKLSIAVDAMNQVVVACKARLSNAHDNKDFIPLVNKAGRFEVVVADKAYDSIANHKHVREKLGRYAVIPVRRNADKVSRVKCRYRKEMFRNFDSKIYFHRNKAESVFYVVKR